MARRHVTLREIARRTGVHESTVSRALNARTRHLVAKDVAARIVAKAEELGYRPNFMAAALRTHRSLMVGVLVADLADPHAAQQLAGIEATLRPAGYAPLVAAVADGDLAQRVASLEDRGIDGLLLVGATGDAASELPVVATGTEGDRATDITTAVSTLARRGHRTIAHLGGPTGDADARMRLAEFRTAMAGAGLFGTTVVACNDWSVAAGRHGADILLGRRADLTAIVAANGALARGALAALEARGLRCPEDISVSGGTISAEDGDADAHETGRRAAELLLARIADGAAPGEAEPGNTVAPPRAT